MPLPILNPPDDEDDAKRAERREGRRRKLDGQAKREGPSFFALRHARRGAIFLGRRVKKLTTDDIRVDLGIPKDEGSKWVPNIMTPLAKAGIFRKVGVTESSRKERRGGDVRIWEYTGDEEATNKWLLENPPLIAVAPGDPVAKHETPAAEQSTSTNMDPETNRTTSPSRNNDAVEDVKPVVNVSTIQATLFDPAGGPNVSN